MALTATQIQARIDALQTARDAGVLRVRHGDTQTEFRSLDEMDRILASLKRDLAAANGTSPKSRVNYIEQTSKGYGDEAVGLNSDGFTFG